MNDRRLATPEEKLIDETFFGGCPHPDYETESQVRFGYRYLMAVCIRCRVAVTIRAEALKTGRFGKLPPREYDPLQQFALLVPHHLIDMVSARAVLRAIEGKGWEWKRLVRDGEFTYSAENGTRRLEGAASRNEVEAVRNMAVKLAKSPLFRFSQ